MKPVNLRKVYGVWDDLYLFAVRHEPDMLVREEVRDRVISALRLVKWRANEYH